MDDLSTKLSESEYGCNLNDKYMNHLFYADDSCMLATSPSALQHLFDICEQYAIEFNITYNENKSHCMLFRPQHLKDLCTPSIFLCGKELAFVTDVKYLGIFIDHNLNDKIDMKRHIRYIYCKGNYLLRNFKQCSDNVKKKLFNTFCSNIYGGHLWNTYSNTDFKKVQVSFNNVYRILFNLKRPTSISQSMVNNRIDHFKVLMRKQIGNFRKRLSLSDNVLISTIFKSVFFMFYSSTSSRWQSILF